MLEGGDVRSLARPRCSTEVNEVQGALAKAQQQVQGVVKAARNEWHKYSYASAEAMLREAKESMADCGLSIFRVDMRSVPFHDFDGVLLLEAVFRVAHESGQFFDIESCLPFQLEKGRPWDKAMLGAQTTMLSYAVRDLLMMPRVSEDEDVSARNDRDYKPDTRRRVNLTDVGSVKKAVTLTLRNKGLSNSQIANIVSDYINYCEAESFEGLNATQLSHLVQACESGANPSTGEALSSPEKPQAQGGVETGKFGLSNGLPAKPEAGSDRPASGGGNSQSEQDWSKPASLDQSTKKQESKPNVTNEPKKQEFKKSIDDGVSAEFKKIVDCFVKANPDVDPDECARVAALRIDKDYGGPWFTQPLPTLQGITMGAEGGIMDLTIETDKPGR